MTRFHAPIAEQIWDMKYRLKQNDGTPVDQTVEETWSRIATALSIAESPLEQPTRRSEFYRALEGFKFLPAGRITAGAGTGRAVTLFNCFVMGTIPDSMAGIFDMLKEAALTMQQGGGIGYDFSPIRPKGAMVKKLGADASGPLTFMDVWDSMCRTVMSAGSRRGAMMATMRCDHPDIMDYIAAKGDTAKLRMFNLSVLVTDEFMEAVKADGDWTLWHVEPPRTKAGEPEPEWLDENGHDGRKGGCKRYVYKHVPARELWLAILNATYSYAEPGVIFIDRINKANNLHYCEDIRATNPCGEQPLPPYGACLLGSVNLAALVQNAFEPNAGIDDEQLRECVSAAVRMMDNVIDVSNFPLEEQRYEAVTKRRIGLGVTGVADALAMVGLRYGSEAAAEQLEIWMAAVDRMAYQTSISLAKEKGAFPLFNADEYLAEGTHASTFPPEVQDEIREHGIRNALLTSIAPTGTISLYAGNVSSGIEPIFANSYTRKVLQPDGTKTEELVEDFAVAAYRKFWEEGQGDPHGYPAERFDPAIHLPDYFVTTADLTPAQHVLMQAAAQRHVDSSISKTVNVPENIPFEEFESVYLDAYESGCKGCTTYRPNEITGSVLSAEPEKTKVVCFTGTFYDSTRAELKAEAEAAGWKVSGSVSAKVDLVVKGAGGGSKVKKAGELGIECIGIWTWRARLKTADLHGCVEESKPEVVEVEAESDDLFDVVAASRTEALPKRPEVLEGKTYKLRVGDQKAVYLTINDEVLEDGSRRPFEVFLKSQDPTHDEFMSGLTRTISAVLRRPYDASFIADELCEIHSPMTGGFQKGYGYQPSILAAVGAAMKRHMLALRPGGGVTKVSGLRGGENGSGGLVGLAPRPGSFCPKCSSYNMKVESGCETCLDCGHSKCG